MVGEVKFKCVKLTAGCLGASRVSRVKSPLEHQEPSRVRSLRSQVTYKAENLPVSKNRAARIVEVVLKGIQA